MVSRNLGQSLTTAHTSSKVIRNSLNNLRTFPYVREGEAEGTLAVHGAWFDIGTGELWVMDKQSGDFKRPDLGE